MNSWVFIIVIVVIAGGLLFLRGRFKMSLFTPKPDVLIRRLELRAEVEALKNEELKKVLEAKRKLMSVKSDGLKLREQIDSVNEHNISGDNLKHRRTLGA